MKAERVQAIVRDLGCTLVGLGGIVHQELTGDVRPWLLGVYTALLGVPGAAGLLQLRGQIQGGPSGASSSSPSPSPASPSGSSSSSPSVSTANGGES